MNNETKRTEVGPPRTETSWSRIKKAFGPVAVVGVVIAKFFAKLKFFILPALKFLPLLLKSGGTMLLMIWVYTMMWGWKFAALHCQRGTTRLYRADQHPREYAHARLCDPTRIRRRGRRCLQSRAGQSGRAAPQEPQLFQICEDIDRTRLGS